MIKLNKKLKFPVQLAIILAVTIILRVFFFEIYLIPTDSMMNTLQRGDVVLLSKCHYGARFFKHDTLVKRAKGISKIKINDVVVFNFPEGDSVYAYARDVNYHDEVMWHGQARALHDTLKWGPIIHLNIANRQPYVKRCSALPGDTFRMINQNVLVNGQLIPAPETIIQSEFWVENHEEFIEKEKEGSWDRRYFPHSNDYQWFPGDYGPLYIPRKGDTVDLNLTNLAFYHRIIRAYEHNSLQVKEDKIFINGKEQYQYVFKQDYFFMLGDFRQYSIDSKYWGFVPKDHIIGKAVLVLFSIDKKEPGESKIRWDRLLKPVR